MDHDHSYKLLFSHPQMMRDLLEAFVSAEWVADVDFSTLERISGTYVADDLRARADDIVWRVRCGAHLLYLLVEFQSSSDRFMAVRVLTYVGLLYQDLIRASKSRDIERLPAILPIVLHTGEKRWSAVDDVSSLVSEAPRGLESYRPQLRYLLIDEAGYDDTELASHRNFAAMLFRLENCRQPDLIPELVRILIESLQGPELESLRRAFTAWLHEVVLKRVTEEQATVVNKLLERPAMLSERFDQWEREFLEKGRQKGRQEGARELMGRLLQKRFGELPEAVHARLRNASLEQFDAWTDRLLDAEVLNDVIECVQPTRTVS